MNKQKGFSMIELLVVIAIIVILIGIIRPSLTASSSRAREFQCESRLKQVGMAMQAYAQDYNQFPAKFDDIDFILQDKTLLQCPSTLKSYHYQKPAKEAKRDDIIVTCVDPQRRSQTMPHRYKTGYLALTAGGHVKRVIKHQ